MMCVSAMVPIHHKGVRTVNTTRKIVTEPAEFENALSVATMVHISSPCGVSAILHNVESIQHRPHDIIIHQADVGGTVYIDRSAIREIEAGSPTYPTIRVK